MAMASGLYGLTLEKAFETSFAPFLATDTFKVALVTNTYTPDFNAHDYYSDVTNVVENNPNWPTAGATLGSPTSAIAAGVYTFDAADVSQASTTLASVRGCVIYNDTITSPAADPLIVAVNFGSDYTTSAGTFAITWNASGIFTIDYTP